MLQNENKAALASEESSIEVEADLERKKLGDSTSLEEGEEAAGTGECTCVCVCMRVS